MNTHRATVNRGEIVSMYAGFYIEIKSQLDCTTLSMMNVYAHVSMYVRVCILL